jgi:Domain of unknown function (DUF4258)
MAITYGKHARDQMELREVSEQDVEAALRRQSRSPTPGEPGSIWIWGFAAGGRILKVCVRSDDHEHVITVAWPN